MRSIRRKIVFFVSLGPMASFTVGEKAFRLKRSPKK